MTEIAYKLLNACLIMKCNELQPLLKKFCKILKRALLSHKVCIITFQHQRTAWTNVCLQSSTSLISNLVLLVLILPWPSTQSLHYRLIYYNFLKNNTFSCLLHVFWADVFEYTWFILKDSINLVILNSFHSLLPVVNFKTIIIIIIILGISFMQGIYTYIPQTKHVPREHCVATILM
jgi:hypothetical protein